MNKNETTTPCAKRSTKAIGRIGRPRKPPRHARLFKDAPAPPAGDAKAIATWVAGILAIALRATAQGKLDRYIAQQIRTYGRLIARLLADDGRQLAGHVDAARDAAYALRGFVRGNGPAPERDR